MVSQTLIVRFLIPAFFLLCSSCPFAAFAQTAAAQPREVPNELLVQIRPKAAIKNVIAELHSRIAVALPMPTILPIAPALGIYRLQCAPNTPLFSYFAAAVDYTEIIHIQANHYVALRNEPNDTDYDLQWNLTTIKAPKAWQQANINGVNTLGDTLVVAILDGGFQTTHEDLQENIWHNKHETPNNGIDDDANGFIDDVNGWDFTENDDTVTRYPMHGTQVAGIIGADGNNNKGITGINQRIKMMLLANIQTEADVVRAYNYTYEMRRRYNQTNGQQGAYIVATNASFGVNNARASQFPLWCAIYDTLGTAGILSVAATANVPKNTDAEPDIPTDCSSPFLIMVTNSDFKDHIVGGFGKQTIDIAAPGDGVYTLLPMQTADNQYGYFGGTSAACPHVAGAIALLYATQLPVFAQQQRNAPVATAKLVKKALFEGVDILTDKTTPTLSGGRLNVGKSSDLLRYWYSADDTDALRTAYPNPCQNYLNLAFNSTQTPIDIKIFDALGRNVLQEKIVFGTPSNRIYTIQTATFQNGLYVVNITFENGTTAAQKIIKQ